MNGLVLGKRQIKHGREDTGKLTPLVYPNFFLLYLFWVLALSTKLLWPEGRLNQNEKVFQKQSRRQSLGINHFDKVLHRLGGRPDLRKTFSK
jgi:hypothetical protein